MIVGSTHLDAETGLDLRAREGLSPGGKEYSEDGKARELHGGSFSNFVVVEL
jgi:hypothetical protein